MKGNLERKEHQKFHFTLTLNCFLIISLVRCCSEIAGIHSHSFVLPLCSFPSSAVRFPHAPESRRQCRAQTGAPWWRGDTRSSKRSLEVMGISGDSSVPPEYPLTYASPLPVLLERKMSAVIYRDH